MPVHLRQVFATIDRRALAVEEFCRADGVPMVQVRVGGMADRRVWFDRDVAENVGLELLRWVDEQDAKKA